MEWTTEKRRLKTKLVDLALMELLRSRLFESRES